MISIFVGDQYLNYSEYFFFLNNFDREDYLKIFLIIFLLIYFIKSMMLITLTFLQSSFNYSIYSKLSKKFLKII